MEEESISMNRYFSESMLEHPEMNRLRAKISDLERQLKELEKLKTSLETEWMSTAKELSETKESLSLERFSYDSVSRVARRLNDQIVKFNKLNPIQKMFYHFDI